MNKTKVIKLMGAWIDGIYVDYEDMTIKYAKVCMKRIYDKEIIIDGHVIIPDRKVYFEENHYTENNWGFN